jgi:peptide/nickel transport system permease protein
MEPTGKQASLALATPERFPTADQWRQGLRWRRWRKLVPMLCGIILVVVMILVAVLAPWFAPFSPSEQFSVYVFKGPGSGGKHLLGTDELGRDLLSRIIWGARVSLQVGLAAVVVGFAPGVPLGIMAVLLGSKVAMTIMRLTDMLMAFPTLLLTLIIVVALEGSLVNEILAIGIALTPNFKRLACRLALTIRENGYIMAARALGCTQVRIMLCHILPNAISTLVVIASRDIASAIHTEAGLSFLGLGVPPPTPSWGNILSEGRQYIRRCT